MIWNIDTHLFVNNFFNPIYPGSTIGQRQCLIKRILFLEKELCPSVCNSLAKVTVLMKHDGVHFQFITLAFLKNSLLQKRVT